MTDCTCKTVPGSWPTMCPSCEKKDNARLRQKRFRERRRDLDETMFRAWVHRDDARAVRDLVEKLKQRRER
jgi:hypothetical protein